MAQITIVSHSYPTKDDLSSGIFIQKEAHLIHASHSIRVLVPGVIALPFQAQFKRTSNLVDEPFPITGFRYLSIPGKKMPVFSSNNLGKKLLDRASNTTTDLFHIHWLLPSGLAIPKLKILGIPLVLTLHGSDWYTNQTPQLRAKIRDVISCCDAVITVGKQMQHDVQSTFPELADNILHIPHGIDSDKFHPPSTQKKQSAQERLQWNSSAVNVLCVANMYPPKGVDLLIEAWGKLRSPKTVHLHLVAPRRDPHIENEVKQRMNELGLNNSVFIYPSQSEEELLYFFNAADFFVSPSRKEGFGLAIAEAISCGLPVLSTKSGGPEEIVNYKVGIQVEADNISALSEGIKQMVATYQDYNMNELHDHISTNFSLDSKANKLNSLYDRLT
jgi:glycosyltransferase involved in cell wall biosynthesis